MLEKTNFDGEFCLSYAKRPNAFLSVQRDCEKFAMVIVKNQQNKEIVGVGICLINKMYVNKQIENVAYLAGLRVDENSKVNIIKAYKMLEDFCAQNDVKYTYTTILKDNLYAQKMLTKKRNSIPDYIKIADYCVNIIRKNQKFDRNYVCKKADSNDFNTLKSFIEHESKNKNFFPFIDIKDSFFDLTYKDFYVLKNKKNEILACGIFWNQTKYKQLIVKHYSKKYRILKKISNFLLKIFAYPTLPNINEIINYSTLSFVLSKNNNQDYINELIKQVSNYCEEDFFVYASINKIDKKITPMNYQSYVYLVDWSHGYLNELNKDNLYIECALL